MILLNWYYLVKITTHSTSLAHYLQSSSLNCCYNGMLNVNCLVLYWTKSMWTITSILHWTKSMWTITSILYWKKSMRTITSILYWTKSMRTITSILYWTKSMRTITSILYWTKSMRTITSILYWTKSMRMITSILYWTKSMWTITNILHWTKSMWTITSNLMFLYSIVDSILLSETTLIFKIIFWRRSSDDPRKSFVISVTQLIFKLWTIISSDGTSSPQKQCHLTSTFVEVIN